MRWDHNVTVTSGGGATPDPVTSPATVPQASCFRLTKRDPQAQELNKCVIVGLEAPIAESVDLELYALNDEDDDGSGAPPAAGRWVLVCEIPALGGGRTAAFEPLSGGGTAVVGGLLYLRVVGENTAADRLVQITATPGGVGGAGTGGATSGGLSSGFSSGQIWPSAAGAPADPTAAYVVATNTFRVTNRACLLCSAVVTALGAEAIQLRVDRSFDYGVTWREVMTRTIPAAAIGTHQVVLDLPEDGFYRIAARRVGGGVATRLALTAEAVEGFVELGRDGNAIELLNAKEVGLLSWHNVGLAEALTLNFATSTSGIWFPVGRANRGKLVVTLSGGVATTVEAQIHESPDATPTDLIPELTNFVTGDIRNVGAAQHQIPGTNGTRMIRFSIERGAMIRTYLKYTGGAAPNALGRIYLWEE